MKFAMVISTPRTTSSQGFVALSQTFKNFKKMGDTNKSRINAVLNERQMQEAKDSIAMIMSLLPDQGTLTLTGYEKGQLASLNTSNKTFVENAIMELKNNGAGIIPDAVNASFIENDLKLFGQLDELHSMLDKLMEIVGSLRSIAANEAFVMANLIYKLFAVSAATGVPNAQASYDRLSERYADHVSGGASFIEND